MVATTPYTKEHILELLSVINDPEIPVVTIQEMGMIADVQLTTEGVVVLLTPTYTGCPAMGIIEQDIRMTLEASGVHPVKVQMVYDPAWTTDWMTDAARQKMKRYGIAPPLHSSCSSRQFLDSTIECPQCHSADTRVISRFGSTACKSLYTCNTCKEPFEYFKCH
ncbi:MAG: phenylacetate-CoA oxygenase subunit PaaJ [Chitinophagia bacterium]|nr:phenylacetate-CoA oxygenase subunit PaaJ [Chitinophagia bacterium]